MRKLSVLEKLSCSKVWMQSLALSIFVGPLIWICGDHSLIWCMSCMFVAPLIVDIIRPTFVVK
jgi:hypothetical protein